MKWKWNTLILGLATAPPDFGFLSIVDEALELMEAESESVKQNNLYNGGIKK